jgi:2-polyprenyl-3-methyl-5-hydroxy-6-metoxy-1,4-benzoquinol methylase
MSFNINYYLVPPKFKRFWKELSQKEFTFLDVGCANGSVLLTKRWFPRCRYFAIDLADDFLSKTESANIERFYRENLEQSDLADVPDRYFDAIVMAHVIEHLTNAQDVLAMLTKKLAPGGRMYIEFPSVRSLNLPSARQTLNFCDDPTHVRVYDVKEVANALLANGMTVVRAGRRRDWTRVFLAILALPLQVPSYLRDGKLGGTGLWDLMGFADFVYARMPAQRD